jgi:PPOX class probable F420-dependent enzyme
VSPSEARSRFAAAQVAVLATVGPGGAPHLVPVTFAVDGDRIWMAVDGKPKRDGELARVRNLRADPRCSLLAHGYDDDWGRLWWTRADGGAAVVSAGPAFDAAVAMLRGRYPQYRDGVEITGPVIVVDVARWSGWSAGR